MRVLAFDPGYDRLGVAILEKASGKEALLHSTCVLTDKNDTIAGRLLHIGEAVSALIREHRPSAVALETLYFNKNHKTAIAVAEARGLLLYLAQDSKLDVYEYTPQQIKVAVTGYGKSSKEQVADMVKRLVSNVPQTALDDEYDAIAVGLTCLASEREPQTA